jgi:hypothetical protein
LELGISEPEASAIECLVTGASQVAVVVDSEVVDAADE